MVKNLTSLHDFFRRITDRKAELSQLFNTDIRMVYRYFDKETFIPFSRLVFFCKNKQLNPKNLISQIKKIKTLRETYKDAVAKEIYSDFLRINKENL